MKPPEEVKRGLVQQWIAKAGSDFGVAKHLVMEDPPYLEAVGFHAQQAAEKYLKAFLVEQQIEFPKTHNLAELLDLVSKANLDLASSLKDAIALTPYGVDIRYPSDFPNITHEAARKAVELARKVRDAIQDVLKGGAPPA